MAGLMELFRLKDFHAMDHDALTKEAAANGVTVGPQDSGYFDRDYIINQLTAREARVRNFWLSTFAFLISDWRAP
jgi:hypothetical protein